MADATNLPFVAKNRTGDLLYDTFLKKTLGYFLPQCLRYVSEVRPVDPIDTIARCLYKSVDINYYQQEKIRYLRDLERANHMLKQSKNKILNRLPPIVQAAKTERDVLHKLREEELQDLLHILENSDDPLDDDITARLNFLADIFNAQMQVKSLLTERAKRFLVEQRLAEAEKKDAALKALTLKHSKGEKASGSLVKVTVSSALPEKRLPEDKPFRDIEEEDKLSSTNLRQSKGSLKEIDKYLEGSKQGSDIGKRRSSSKSSLKRTRSHSRKDLESSSSTNMKYEVFDYYDSRTEIIRKGKGSVPSSKMKVKPESETDRLEEEFVDYDTESEVIQYVPSKRAPHSDEVKEDDDEALKEFKDILDKGRYAITKNGLLAYVSKTLGVIAPKPSKYTPYSASDMPEQWLKKQFACESLYDSELYTVCDYGNLDELYSDIEEISLAEYKAPVIKKLGMSNVAKKKLGVLDQEEAEN
ncbi:mesocentin [Biomphalaria pfeifferi]|uniref:Mesocentin n=1 Tax=Biomphalaria pfeifferi TaxID=112525 RepID=A0AAD8BUJ0_BIOPF|nr:mesocentin [Biomphalaria pfeifferi]